MRWAFLLDVHANLAAARAALGEARRAGADHVLHGGDLVGWGPQPNEVVELFAHEQIAGVMGNHELLVLGRLTEAHELRNASTAWTRSVLSESCRQALADLPLAIHHPAFTLCHANPFRIGDPPRLEHFAYLGEDEPISAYRHDLQELAPLAAVVGHTHIPRVVSVARDGGDWQACSLLRHQRLRRVMLEPQRRYLVMAGSVGKPRDGVPAANLALLDEAEGWMELRRVGYNVRGTCELIRAASGLPPVLAEQLARGL